MAVGAVLQSGSITPGQIATWATDGVIQAGGPIGAYQKVLTSQRGASFNTITDQPLVLPGSILAFMLTGIVVTNASLNMTTAVGGFYSGALKTGTQIVAASQTYTTLTTPNVLAFPVLTANIPTTRFSAANLLVNTFGATTGLTIYFSLTTPQGAIATADVYLLGIDLS